MNRARAAPRTTTLVTVPASRVEPAAASLTSTNPGSSRSPPEISASSTSSKPAPVSTSSHSAATRSFSEGGSSTVACAPRSANHGPGR